MWVKIEPQLQYTTAESNNVSFERIVHHFRTRTRRCVNTILHTTLHFFQIIHTCHLTVIIQYHRMVMWPYEVRSKSLRPAAQWLLPFTMHQEGQVFAQCTMRTPRQHPCLRKWIRDKASEGWLQLLMHKRKASAILARLHHSTAEKN